MLRNDEIQAAIVSYLKGKSAITSLLANGAEEVREDQWQGTGFKYPNVRVRLIDNEPEQPNCNLHRVTFSCLVFSEQDSSQQADEIAGIINNTLHGTSFSSIGISFSTRTTSLVPAIRSEYNLWRAETIMEARVSG